MEEFIVYHGTDADQVESIRQNSFFPSTTQFEWLGTGVYFYTEGAFDPILCARDWAISSAWDKDKKKLTYKSYSILMTIVSGDRVLDLRSDKDLGIFEELRQHILAKFEKDVAGQPRYRRISAQDNYICNAVAKSMDLDILIHNLYIKTKRQRIKNINSRVPNSAVLCAKETASISIEDIEVIETGKVK